MLGSIMLSILSSRDIRLAYLSLLFWGGKGGAGRQKKEIRAGVPCGGPGGCFAHLETARPGCEAALPLRDDSKETETASTPSFVIAGSKIL